ncbi:MAG: AAA family ATPase [Planctomycetales bacterium]|nr:AAA family ATPase [Planctomycetales bacterium]
MLSSLASEVWELVRAGFSGIWIETHEAQEAINDIVELGIREQLNTLSWNLDTGLRGSATNELSDPLSVVRLLSSIESDQTTLLILENYHRFLDSAEVCQALLTQLKIGKQLGRHVIVLAPFVKLPLELERQFVVVSHSLPDRTQLWAIAESLINAPVEYSASDRNLLLDAAVGLTRCEAESAYSLSLVRHGRLTSGEIWNLKATWLKKSGLLRLYQSTCGFSSLGGLENLKQFSSDSLRRSSMAIESARGVMLLGVPGTGKSAFAKALGFETGRPVLTLDVGQLMGSLVGQSEANIRAALGTADAMAPCILFIDEVEKGLAGVSNGSKGDSGVSGRVFGTLLTWLNDHTSDVYVVVTCNNIQQLPPEFSRAERFDAIMFLDLPTREEKDAIWQLYLEYFQIPHPQSMPEDNLWTGAEIKACCRLANLLGLPLIEAGSFIIPVGVSAQEEIERLRTWASGRCLNAGQPGIFRRSTSEKCTKSNRRNINLRPSQN